MDDRILREMNVLENHAELLRQLQPLFRPGRVRRASRAPRLHRRLAAWLGGRLVRWGTDLARHGGPAPARRAA